MRFFNTTLIAILMVFLGVQYAFSQIIAPTGVSTRASSQLVYYYDNAGENSIAQVVNTHPTTGVWIHVQIFRNFNVTSSPDVVNVICDERNFVDFLTPTDTHVYDLDTGEFAKNDFESTSIDVSDTKGFIVITPVVSEADLTAISFQFLTGSTKDDSVGFVVNAMGRDAVNFTTGEPEPIGTPLDGSTNGFVNLQPEELLFDFAGDSDNMDIVGIAFSDVYGEPGLLGYAVAPADATLTSFIFDFKEDPTSCGNRPLNCFLTLGLNDTFGQNNTELSPNVDDLLCAGSETPEYDPSPVVASFDDSFEFFGWTRMFVSGIEGNENLIGYYVSADGGADGADIMRTRGERTEIDPEPVPEVCDDPEMADEDEDGFANCLDSDCATAENCETGVAECTNGTDDDGDGDIDCADLGCDGTVVDSEAGIACEFGSETSCDDGFDNDGDGDVDEADSDCMVADTGGDGGDGGGCNVAGTVTTATAAANFLLPLLPLAGAYGYRRLRRRNSK